MSEALGPALQAGGIVVVLGPGGVGKTTTAAALSLAAAMKGLRVLCLTIDPARGLAEALGLDRTRSDEQQIDASRLAEAGVAVKGSLSAMMLDTKRTFDELIIKYSSSPDRARQLLSNRLYQYVSTSLVGTQDYMALEKLASVQRDPRFDFIVLDTPPTANALDFLDAPERLVGALDSTTTRAIVRAFQTGGTLGAQVFARSAAAVLRGFARVTGAEFLSAMAQLLGELNDLFGGFRNRAQAVEAILRGPTVTFVVVASPSPSSVEEAVFVSNRLRLASMSRFAFVVNRVRTCPPTPEGAPAQEQVRSALESRGLPFEQDLLAHVTRAYADAKCLAKLDAAHIGRLRFSPLGQSPVICVPELTRDVRELRGLADVAGVLTAPVLAGPDQPPQ